MSILARSGIYVGMIALTLSLCCSSYGQASATTGSIIGTVTDNSNSVIPGVEIAVSGPELMGGRAVVTEAQGEYRISALPPGTYQLVFHRDGFGSVTRQGILISVGFTATINVTMNPASLTQSVAVSSESPVVDVTATHVTTDFTGDQLVEVTGKKDYAMVLGLTPVVTMARPSVGGSGAIAYQRSTRYGMMGGDWGVVEGMAVSEGGAGGFEVPYVDLNGYADMSVSVIGNSAEMSQPGTFTTTVAKSGGNSFHGQAYFRYGNSALETTNIDAKQLALGVSGGNGVSPLDTNRLDSFQDLSAGMGGYVLRDKLWWYGEYSRTSLSEHHPNLLGGKAQEARLPSYMGKLSYNLTKNNTLTAFYQRGTKEELPADQSDNTTLEAFTAAQNEIWPNGIASIGWNSILSNAVVLQVHVGNFFERGYFNPNTPTNMDQYNDVGLNELFGNPGSSVSRHNRWQAHGDLTYYKTRLAGTHNFKFGGGYFLETEEGQNFYFNDISLTLNNGAPAEVTLFLPTTNFHENLRSFGLYAQDSWQIKPRLTLNLGIRFDQYLSYTPAQVSPTGVHYSRFNAPTWNNAAPRVGVNYALTRDGKTLLKASYGRFWWSPYVSIGGLINPNADTASTYAWTPTNPTIVNGFPVFQPGQQGALLFTTGGTNPDGTPLIALDRNLKNTYTHQVTAYFEREVAPNFGVRSGFVWNAWRQGYGVVNTSVPSSAYNVPVSVPVPGPDGLLTDSTGTVTAYNLSPASLNAPLTQVVQNSSLYDSDWYTWEITATKRQTGRWSMMASFFNTWSRESPFGVTADQSESISPYTNPSIVTPNIFINTNNGRDNFTNWGLKVSGSLQTWKGISFLPTFSSQSGWAFARTFTTSLNYNPAVSIYAEPWGKEHLPVINLLSVRTEKKFTIKERWNITVNADVYNIFNTNAAQSIIETSGSSFMFPSVITSPRAAQFGAKFDF